ncbi:MAG: hypothetical protein ACRDRJ_17725, partial [Streptosporangiaceae bacterium]
MASISPVPATAPLAGVIPLADRRPDSAAQSAAARPRKAPGELPLTLPAGSGYALEASARRTTLRRTWLDTFDWRLNRAGLNLTYENTRRGSRLLLTVRHDPIETEQPAAGWQPKRPALAEDLPAGPVRDEIEKLISPRALLPVVITSTTVSVCRLTNPDGKTVARLIAASSTVTQAGVTVGLPTRLT